MTTESMQTSIDFFESDLAGDTRLLMLCLAPFIGLFHGGWKGFYTDHLKVRPELEGLPFDQWDDVIKVAEQRGLIKPHDHFGGMGYMIEEPMFSIFLKTRLEDPAMARQKKAIEGAFCDHYNEIGGQLARLLRSDDAETRQTGLALIGLENENLLAAVTIGLLRTSAFYPAFDALSFLMIQRKNFSGLTNFCQWVLTHQAQYTSVQLQGEMGTDFFTVNDRLAGACLKTGDAESAKRYYENGLALCETSNDPHVRTMGKANTLNQLGRLAVDEGQWAAATAHALDAAGLFHEHGDESGFMRMVTSLARIWGETKDAAIPETIGKLKGQSQEEVESMLTRINQPQDDEPA